MAAENEEPQQISESSSPMAHHKPEIPTGRIKRIMKIDKEINRVSSEALHLISCSTELFIQFLAEKSARVALEKKKKTIKVEHLRVAVKRHQPTSDFLLDSLPPVPVGPPSQTSDQTTKDRRARPSSSKNKAAPDGTRRIDAFFNKCT